MPSNQTKIIDALGEDEDDTLPDTYSISSYGADYPVETLVRRLEAGDIVIPAFQRSYVWNYRQASRFIESLLLGLPVPAIFLSKEAETGKFLVIDGQQRLKTLQYFYEGLFPQQKGQGREFSLVGVLPRFRGLTYKRLSPELRRNLDNSILHAIIFKQDNPAEGNSSIYHVFERLNTGGTRLQAQEIRASIFHGRFQLLLRELNDNSAWREIFGPVSSNQRDEELILRFLALHFNEEDYKEPMKQFLNNFISRNRNLQAQSEDQIRQAFEPTIQLVRSAIGPKAFRPQRALNAAVFDAVMIGLARRLKRGQIRDEKVLFHKYQQLIADQAFQDAVGKATADVDKVHGRIRMATESFAGVK